MPTTDRTGVGVGEQRLSPKQRELHGYVTGLATDRKMDPATVLDELIRGHDETSSPGELFREFADRWGLSPKRLADLQELLGTPTDAPASHYGATPATVGQALAEAVSAQVAAGQPAAAGMPIRQVDPAEVEADIDAFMAESEPQRRADRLAAGIVDSEVVPDPAPVAETRQTSACGCGGRPHRLDCPQRRVEVIAAARAALDWLEAHPEVPVWRVDFHDTILVEDDQRGEAEIRRVAAVIGIEPTVNDHHVHVGLEFGDGVRYGCIYPWQRSMAKYEARLRGGGSR